MIDAVLAATCGATFKTRELVDEAVGFREDDAARVQEGQQVAVKVGLWFLADGVVNAAFAELFARKFTGIAITDHTGDAVRRDEVGEVVDNWFGRERRFYLA